MPARATEIALGILGARFKGARFIARARARARARVYRYGLIITCSHNVGHSYGSANDALKPKAEAPKQRAERIRELADGPLVRHNPRFPSCGSDDPRQLPRTEFSRVDPVRPRAKLGAVRVTRVAASRRRVIIRSLSQTRERNLNSHRGILPSGYSRGPRRRLRITRELGETQPAREYA